MNKNNINLIRNNFQLKQDNIINTTQATQKENLNCSDKKIITSNMCDYRSEKNLEQPLKTTNLFITSQKKHHLVLSDENIRSSKKFLNVNNINSNSTQQGFYNKMKIYTKLMPVKRNKKTYKSYFSNKYVSSVIETAKEKNTSYNSGNFNVPLIGFRKKNKSIIKIKCITNINKYKYKKIFNS